MNLKNITLILISLFLIFYVIYFVIEDVKITKNTTCKSVSCLRFCDDSNLENLNSSSLIQNEKFEELSLNFSVISDLCSEKVAFTKSVIEWKFTPIGLMNATFDDKVIIFKWNEYCLSFYDETRIEPFLCRQKTINDQIQENYPSFLLSSVPFLIVTIFIFAWIPELRNLPGKCLMCYTSCVTALYIVISLTIIFYLWEYPVWCYASGFVQYILFLMCLMWLNVLIYNLWSNLKKTRVLNETFLKYCFYAFGGPIIVSLFVFIFHQQDVILRTCDGRKSSLCLVQIQDNVGLWYIIVPIAIIMTLNLVLYCLTAYTVFTVSKRASLASPHKNQHNKRKFFLLFRLFMINATLSIDWVAGVIFGITGPSIILSILSMINCYTGILIFMHFIWRSKVEKLIRKKLNLKIEGNIEIPMSIY